MNAENLKSALPCITFMHMQSAGMVHHSAASAAPSQFVLPAPRHVDGVETCTTSAGLVHHAGVPAAPAQFVLPAPRRVDGVACGPLSIADDNALIRAVAGSWDSSGSRMTLNLSRCSGLTRLPEWLGGLTGLQTIKLYGCSRLTRLPESIGGLTTGLTGLQTLNLHQCSGLTGLPELLLPLRGRVRGITAKRFCGNTSSLK